MIALIEGKVVDALTTEVVILTTSGIGYKLQVSPGARKRCVPGQSVSLPTYLAVREDALDLFGFADNAERDLFKMFLSVSGVGPKTALNVLALGSASEISRAISRGDVDYLTKVSGIGKKTAERLVMELRSKISEAGVTDSQSALTSVPDEVADVVSALEALGYSSQQARDAVKKLDTKGKNSEKLLREALQQIK